MTTSASPSVNRARLHDVRVLVADDASYVRQAVTDILESVGAVVTTVGSAEAALTALQAEPPDVLVSDLSIPGDGGYWLIGQCGPCLGSAVGRPLPPPSLLPVPSTARAS